MKKPVFRIIGLGLLVLGLSAGALWSWRQSVLREREAWSAKTLERAINDRDFVTAKSALNALSDANERAAKETEIRSAELSDGIARRDAGVIRQATSGAAPADLRKDLLEQADLVLAREALWNRNQAECESLAKRWSGNTAFPGRWTLLAADLMLSLGEKEQAREFLEKAELEGEEDALRHVRLALIHAGEPWQAMDSIDAGLRTNPRSAELLSFRAQIQEAAGRLADARLDYVAAVLSEPANPLYRDVLANFQLRMGEPSNAAETWRDAAEATELGLYAFKGWFWSRICGVPLSRPLPEVNQPGWAEVMREIGNLPDGAFTSAGMEHAIAGISGLPQRPEVVWLRVLESVRGAEWETAISRLESGFPPAAETMAPGLGTRLLVNLAAVSGGEPRVALAGRDLPVLPPEPHPFLVEFDQWKRSSTPQDDAFPRWLANPASLAATLFAHGWHGAALDAGGGAKLAPVDNAPAWFDFGYSRCLLVRDGPDAARRWLESLPELSEAAQLTHAEILLTGGEAELGMKKLAVLATGRSPHAGRAAWSLALAELDRGNTAEAVRLVKGSPELLASVRGKEILARAALSDGAADAALEIYLGLGEESADAMIYLSKRAFAEKDWEAARKWTGELARRFPAEPQFRKNLLSIDDAEAGKP